MQLPVAEDLLRNIEGFAQAIGDVLMANSSEFTDSKKFTIERDDIGKLYTISEYIVCFGS